MPGATARFTSVGEPGASAFFLLAALALPVPIDLSRFGGQGCELWLIPEVAVPSMVGASRGGRPAATRLDLPLPAMTTFVGATFATQWLLVGTSGLATSNALVVSLAGLPTRVEGSVVSSAFDSGDNREIGLAQVGVLPVIRLHW